MKHLFIMPFLCKWEGGLSRDKSDKASKNPCPIEFQGHKDWHTNMGVIWPTYNRYCDVINADKDVNIRANRFFHLTKDDVANIFKVLYWDAVYGDNYTHQAIGNCMASWAWGSGVGRYSNKLKDYTGALKQIRIFCKDRGLEIPKIWADVPHILNTITNHKALFDHLCEARKEFFINISKEKLDGDNKIIPNPNAKFRKGWLNRLEAFKKFNQELF